MEMIMNFIENIFDVMSNYREDISEYLRTKEEVINLLISNDCSSVLCIIN